VLPETLPDVLPNVRRTSAVTRLSDALSLSALGGVIRTTRYFLPVVGKRPGVRRADRPPSSRSALLSETLFLYDANEALTQPSPRNAGQVRHSVALESNSYVL
jgi:hypothetical protein